MAILLQRKKMLSHGIEAQGRYAGRISQKNPQHRKKKRSEIHSIDSLECI